MSKLIVEPRIPILGFPRRTPRQRFKKISYLANMPSAPFTCDARYGTCLLLDGGTGHELKLRTDAKAFVYTSLMNVQEPGVVTDVHSAFVRAGATAVTANCYGATPHHLAKAGVHIYRTKNRDMTVTDVCTAACSCARNAGARTVLASLPPLGESYERATEELLAYANESYGAMLAGMQDADGLIAETLTTSEEGVAAALAARRECPNLPLLVSFTCHDTGYADRPTLRGSNERLEDAVRAVDAACTSAGVDPPDGYSVNCNDAAMVLSGVKALRRELAAARLVGGYANVFPSPTSAHFGARRGGLHIRIRRLILAPLRWLKRRGARAMTPDAFAKHVCDCADAGANIVGGCCGAAPEHIARASELLAARAKLR